jgi:beta-mannosidase
LPCEGAQPEAEPWICSVNGKSLFLQGINWTPVRPNFADLKEEDYRFLMQTYKDLGINMIRVWGGSFPEKEWLYDLCDEMGILVWQDFPLSSSGLDNYPPTGNEEIRVLTQIVDHYVTRLRHHASLLLWCAGNELYEKDFSAPVTDKHPLIGAMKKRVQLLDPHHKFVDGSPSGPNISPSLNNFGSGNNWDVHGPWELPYKDKKKQDIADVIEFWTKDDALFHSEVGAPGAMQASLIKKYCGDYPALPANLDNPVWRSVNWWIEWDSYLDAHNGQEPANLEEYVDWSQKRQSDGLCIIMEKCKNRFPRCGGVIIWMGHDSFPCFVNTSIIDFEGNLKPAALALSKIWKNNSK